jgi:D-alanine-D-alanine ligase
MQGLLESLNIPHTSTTQESSVIVMNKQLTKDQVGSKGIGVVPGLSFLSTEIQDSSEKISSAIQNELGLPVIIKPVHLGSSIGIKVAKTDIELEKYLLEAAFIDREVLVEKYLTGFVEYNCAVRFVNGEFETSEIEKPLSNDEILSFTDKYERGGKKTGGDGGMASLIRELPAKIDASLKQEIQSTAIEAFTACRCKGMVRIDFMYTSDNQLLLTEVNPIPGSMAYYLWEASGIPFKQQITDLIEQSVLDQQKGSSMELDYKSDIVEKFIT